MLRLGIDQHGQRSRHADAVVGAERRPLGPHPFALDAGADRIPREIELDARILLADHIHMRLQDHFRPLFITRRSRLAHHHVADLVGMTFDAVLGGEPHEVFPDFLLLLRGTRHPGNRVELLPYEPGFETGYFRHRC